MEHLDNTQNGGQYSPTNSGDRDSGIESAESQKHSPDTTEEWKKIPAIILKEEEGQIIEIDDNDGYGDGRLQCAICGDEATGIHYDVILFPEFV